MTAKRGIKTIIGSFFRRRGRMGAEATTAAFLASVIFVLVLFVVVVSLMIWRFPYHLFSDEVYNVVAVNAPESFVRFNEQAQVYRDREAEAYGDPTDLWGNYRNIISFRYNFDGYGSTKYIYKENDALYDFVSFGKWMRENDAYLTVVFPKDFDEQVEARRNGLSDDKPQILTYYRTDSLEYSAMKNEYIEIYLSGYESSIRASYGLAVTSISDSEIFDDPIATVKTARGIRAVIESLCRSFLPILLFVILLYYRLMHL